MFFFSSFFSGSAPVITWKRGHFSPSLTFSTEIEHEKQREKIYVHFYTANANFYYNKKYNFYKKYVGKKLHFLPYRKIKNTYRIFFKQFYNNIKKLKG